MILVPDRSMLHRLLLRLRCPGVR